MWLVLGKLVIRSHLAMQAALAVVAAWAVKHQKTLLPIALGVVATLLVVALLRLPSDEPTGQGSLAQDIEVYQKKAEAASAFADSVGKAAAKRQRQVARLEREIARLKGQIPDPEVTDSLRAEADSLFAALSDSVKGAYRVIPVQQAVIVRQDSTIRSQVRVIAKQDTAMVKKDTTIVDLTRSRDSLATVLRLRPEPPKEVKLLGIFPAPNRKQSAVFGAFVGVLGTAWLLK
jgi:hypothetical protein